MTEIILIGEDDPVQRRMAVMLLTKKLGYKVIEAENGEQVLALIESSNVGEINAVLLDIMMPGMDGFETLSHIRRIRPDLPVLMLTGQDDTAVSVKAIKAGASDFIVKPPNPAQLDIALKNAIRMSSLSRELSRLKRDKVGALGFADLVGHEGGLAEVIDYGRKAAASDIAVLVTGETSSGKELFARTIHGESRRVGAPFVAINCSAIPENMIEATLFGYEKSAVAGAAPRSIGKFREAERGTVFLDDIHLLSPDAQVKLLRVLQQHEVEPVGSPKPVKVNIRIISATHVDLKAEVQSGRFREDLYFRLNVLAIHMPSLRERNQDIIPLVEYFIKRLSSMEALPFRELSMDAKHYLVEYSWPGNVRELEGLIHRALVLCEKPAIDRALLMQIHQVDSSASMTLPQPGTYIHLKQAGGMFKTMTQIEAETMQNVLSYYEQNITKAAAALGIAKSTFYRKIKDTND